MAEQILITIKSGFEPVEVERFESVDGERYKLVGHREAKMIASALYGAGHNELAAKWNEYIERMWI